MDFVGRSEGLPKVTVWAFSLIESAVTEVVRGVSFTLGAERYQDKDYKAALELYAETSAKNAKFKTVYDQMLEPKWVISMGACACSGGFYNNYTVLQGIDKIIPVDVYIPGCPPNPEGIIDAVVQIQRIIETGAPRAAERWPIK